MLRRTQSYVAGGPEIMTRGPEFSCLNCGSGISAACFDVWVICLITQVYAKRLPLSTFYKESMKHPCVIVAHLSAIFGTCSNILYINSAQYQILFINWWKTHVHSHSGTMYSSVVPIFFLLYVWYFSLLWSLEIFNCFICPVSEESYRWHLTHVIIKRKNSV